VKRMIFIHTIVPHYDLHIQFLKVNIFEHIL
jgi:hypothetical protein